MVLCLVGFGLGLGLVGLCLFVCGVGFVVFILVGFYLGCCRL